MHLSIIVAMDRAGLIGDEKGLPWRLPTDLRWFKEKTMGRPVILGRKTFQLIGKPLPGRHNIVMSHDRSFSQPGCIIAHSVAEALAAARAALVKLDWGRKLGREEIMVIGGGSVYAQFIERCATIYLTVVDGRFKGTTYFPKEWLLRPEWRVSYEESMPADEKNLYGHHLYWLERLPLSDPSAIALPLSRAALAATVDF